MATAQPPLNFFPLPEPRNKQVRALEFIQRALDLGYQDIILAIPTGGGKSAIGVAACLWASQNIAPNYKAGGYYLVCQKLLQDQLEHDFPRYLPQYHDKVCSLKSAIEYECPKYTTCMAGSRMPEGLRCHERAAGFCLYTIQKERFCRAPVAITNYPYFFCYSDDTEVLTKRGWLRFADTTNTDEFATRRIHTGEFEWQRRTSFFRKHYVGNLIKFKNRSLDLLVTPNHRMLIDRLPRPLGGFIRRHRDTKGHLLNGPREAVVTARDLLSHRGSNTGIPVTSVWHGQEIKSKLFIKNNNRGHSLALTGDEFCAFMGMYLAEGSLGPKNQIVISQPKNDKRGVWLVYNNLLRSIFKRKVYFGGHQFQISRKALHYYLKQFGYAHEKYIPADILNATPRQLSIFWRYYYLGDGAHRTAKQIKLGINEQAITVSRKLADHLTEVLQKMGATASVCTRPAGLKFFKHKNHYRQINAREAYIIIRGKRKVTKRWTVSESKYNGYVCCISVPNTFLYVRRNGKAAWCGNTERTYVKKLEPRTMLIADECHTLEKQILNFVDVHITRESLEEWTPFLRPVPSMPTIEEFAVWLKTKYVGAVEDRLSILQENLITDHANQKLQIEFNKAENHLNRVKAAIVDILRAPDNWVYWQEEKDGQLESIAKPLFAQSFVKPLLLEPARIRVYMSAYPGPKKVFCRNLGLDPAKVARLDLNSTFHVEHRPIHLLLCGSMGRKSIDETTPRLLRVADKILAAHPNEKGLIHCHSYKLGDTIFKYLKTTEHAKRILYPRKADEREEAFKKHTGNGAPTVLLSPSMTEGFSLDDDLARFQVIAKIPYPNLGDKQVEAKKDIDQEWYTLQTITAIVQACGRIVRSDTDHGVTYVLDGDFMPLFEKNSDFFPRWFTDAFIWHNK